MGNRKSIEYEGQIYSLTEIAEKVGYSTSHLGRMLRKGKTVEQVISRRSKSPYKSNTHDLTPGVDETLCWTCSRDGRTCSWMKDFTPVEGWNVTNTTVRFQHKAEGKDFSKLERSYFVHTCPLYCKFKNIK